MLSASGKTFFIKFLCARVLPSPGSPAELQNSPFITKVCFVISMRTRKQKKIPKKIKCAICPNRFVPKNKRQKYCSKECCYKANRIEKNNWYHKDDPHYRTCAYCLKSVKEYGFCNACSQECHDKLAERYRIQAQKKPCRRCGHDITRARNHKYCSDKCRYEAWRDGKRKHPKNSNCKRCKKKITDKKQLVYCTTECRLEHIREKYEATHGKKKCENCPVMLVNVRRKYCTAKCRRSFNFALQEERDAKKAEAARNAKADPNYLENSVKKIQREAEERRRALRGLS